MISDSSRERAGAEDSSGIDSVGDLAVVLHSHMPYVEGFGTYPFGEEWLFDAFARSHLPVLDVARDLTMSVTPVLADQLEAPGVIDRVRTFLLEHRIAAAERDVASAGELAVPAGAELSRYRRALERLDELDGDPLEAFRAARRDRGVALIASAATHAVLPLVATAAGRRLQLDTGLRSHRRRFGPPAGLWLPECAYEPGLEEQLARAGVELFCLDHSAHEPPLDSLAPVRTRSGPVALTIDWGTVSLVWSERGYPSGGEYVEYHRLSPNGIRLWAFSGAPYDPGAAARAAERDAERFADHVARRLGEFRSRRGAPGVVVFAIDTELLGHWWSEGPEWLAHVLRLAPERGVRLVTLPEAARRHATEERPLRASSWGEGKDMRTWDSPRVADIAWAARRLELRLLAAVERGLTRAAAERAARELLALQASDWAFLDARRQAGDYPYRRAVNHAESLLEAIDSDEPPDPRMRNLAPDLRLSSLLEP
jgi:1,4-alpha-glucan branching enzyme